MIRRARVVLVAVAAIILAIPLLPGPGVFIVMAALADIHDAFQPSSAAGFPPADAADAGRTTLKRLSERDLRGGRRVA
jgi:hypothetical protein